MEKNPALQMIGLANKAGKIASGETAVEKAVKSGNAYLCIVAEDASERTKKDSMAMCVFYHTSCVVYESRERLGEILGKPQRALCAVTEEGFARAIEDKIAAEMAKGNPGESAAAIMKKSN